MGAGGVGGVEQGPGGPPPGAALLERLRAAAHAAVDADDAPAAVALTRLLEERDPVAPVVSLDVARARHRARAAARRR